jgi:DNA-binding response OmpR family regulator
MQASLMPFAGSFYMAQILCVDDELPFVTQERAILEAAGHKVTIATSAREAVEKLQSEEFDLVVTGWHLGDADGHGVVEAARNNKSRAIPVVVVTSFVQAAFQSPEPVADLYLEKPVDPEELVLIVNELLKKTQPSIPVDDLYLEKPVDPEELIAIVNELLKRGGGGSATPE